MADTRNTITWPLVGGSAVTVTLALVGVIYGLVSNRVERLESNVQQGTITDRQHDTDIVKLQSTIDYIKLGQDDMKQSIAELVTLLREKQ